MSEADKLEEDIPTFKLYYDVTTPEGKAEREKLQAHGNKPCYFDYGPDSPLGKMYVEAPQGRET